MKELTLWLNGSWILEKEAKVSIFDDGFLRGDAVFDVARTFQGKPFQLREHVERLLQSCRFLDLRPGFSEDDLVQIGEEMAQRNNRYLKEYGDFWIDYHVTRGVERPGYEAGPSMMVYCDPIPFRQRAPLYRDGIPICVSGVRRTHFSSVSPRVKSHNYVNFVLANLQARATSGAWPILLDERGNLTEGTNSNIFLVRKGQLFTPREQCVLPGISRRTVIQLAKEIGISVLEMDLDLHDLYLADEIFLTSTSLCLCGVSKVDGRAVGASFPGPVTCQLTTAYSELVGIDIRAQYLSFLETTD